MKFRRHRSPLRKNVQQPASRSRRKADRAKVSSSCRRRFQPRVESLEDRRLLAIDYAPVFGTQMLQSSSPFTVMNNATVNVLLWGNWGTGAGQTDPSTVNNEVSAILNSAFLNVVQQYGSNGTATLGTTFIDSVNPVPANFTPGNLTGAALTDAQNEITSVVNAGNLPGPSGSPSVQAAPIYAIITDPPNSHPPASGGFNGGYNTSTTVNGQNANVISVGTDSNFVNFGDTFSHEMAEKISDPTSGGVVVSAGASIPANTNFLNNPAKPPSDPSNWGQIGDFEPEPGGGFHYTYRIGGPASSAIVQAIWSNADSAFVVEDGNSEVFTLAPHWSNVSATTGTFDNTYDLTINGDQLASKDDNITISADSAGGVQVNLNGQIANFDPPTAGFQGTQLTSIKVNGLTGNNQLTIDYSQGAINVPITYDGGSGAGTRALTVTGYSGVPVTATGTGAHAGTVLVGTNALISYSHLSPLTLAGTASDLVVNLPTAIANPDVIVGFNGVPGDSDIRGSTFEDTEFANPSNSLTVNLGTMGDTITLEAMDAGFNPAGVGVPAPFVVNGGAANVGDTYHVEATSVVTDIVATGLLPSSISSVTVGNAGLTSGITGTLNIENPASGNAIIVDDSADPAVLSNVTLSTQGTNPNDSQANVDVYGQIAGIAPANVNYEYLDTSALTVKGSAGGTTFNVQTTGSGFAAGFVTTLDGGPAADTFNVSSTAPAVNGNGTLTGNLEGINGQLDINSGGGGDTLNVSDYSGPGGATYALSTAGGKTTLSTSTAGVANIVYDANGTAGQLANFNLTGSNASGNTYNIDATTATTQTTIGDGDASASGDSTFNITGDALSAANDFEGFGGNDTFNLNVTNDLGGTNVTINGGPPAGDSVNRDRLNIGYTGAGGARDFGFDYLSQTSGDMNVSGFAIPINVLGMETLVLNPTVNNNTATVTGVSGASNTLTVGLLPTLPASATLPVGTTAASSAVVFLGGTPYLNAPPVTIANSRPGIAGGGFGPDLLINGIAPFTGLTLDGGANPPAGGGNHAVVYAASENSLVDGANPTDIFGFGAGVLQPGFGVGNAYDFISVSDGGVSSFNNDFGSLVNVNLNTASFVQNSAPSSTQAPGLIVNGGDEAAPQADGIADEFSVFTSTKFNIQINGNLPNLTTVNGVPQGDQLDAFFPGSINVFSDNASPPNVTLTGQTSNSDSPFGIKYSSIERVDLTPGNGIVNIIGDNNVAGGNQNDYFKVRGGIDPFSFAPTNGMNQFSLQIGGSWDPATGNVGTPTSGGLSSAIWFNGVTRINASGGAATGWDTHGNAIPDTADPAGTNVLDLTPYANNTPVGWGIETYWNQGNAHLAGGDGGLTNPDLLAFNGVAGVSENITIQPSASQAGQVFDNNAATNTPIAVVNYTNNSNIIVNGSSPAGTAGDTDNLFVNGTAPANPGTSGNEDVLANFAATGDGTHPMVRVYDAGAVPPVPRPSAAEEADTIGTLVNNLFNLQSFSNFNTINFNTLGGNDLVELLSGRTDGSLAVNVNTGSTAQASTPELTTLTVDGTAGGNNSFVLTPGTTNDSGSISALVGAAAAATTLNFGHTQNIQLVGGGGGAADTLTVNGTQGNDTFQLTATGAGAGTAQVSAGPLVTFSGLGSASTINLNGDGGSDTFIIRQIAGWGIPDVFINGNGSDTLQVIGDAANADNFAYTPVSANAGTLSDLATTYHLTGIGGLSIDGNDTTTVNSLAFGVPLGDSYFITPGSDSNSGSITINAGGQNLLGISYKHIQSVTPDTSSTAVVSAPEGGSIVVDTNGVVTVRDSSGIIQNTYDFSGDTSPTFTLDLDVLAGNVAVTIDQNTSGGTRFGGGIQVIGSNSTGDTLTVDATVAGTNSVLDFLAGTIANIVTGNISLFGVTALFLNGASSVGGASTFTLFNYGPSPANPGLTAVTLNANDIATGTDAIDINTATGPSTIDYTPLSDSSATLTRAEGGPAINVVGFNNTDGSLSLNRGGNVLAVNFIGSQNNDAITATHVGTNGTHIVDVINGSAVAAAKWVPIDVGTGAVATSLSSLAVLGGLGDDTFTVDDTAGALAIVGGIFYDGGAGSNSLVLTGTTAADSDVYSPGPGAGQGTDTMSIGGTTQKVSFANLAPVIDLVPSATLTVNGTNKNDAINYSQGPNSGSALVGGATTGLVSVNGLETTEFANKTALAIDTGSGTDTVSIADATTPTGLTGNVTVNGGDPAAGDTLIVSESAGNPLVLEPTAQGAGTINRFNGGLPATVFTGMGYLTLVGQVASNDPFGIDGTAGNDSFEYIPGATPDTGKVVGTMDQNNATGKGPFPLVPTTFTGMSQGGLLRFDAFGQAGGSDTFTLDGTSANDTISVGRFGAAGLTFTDVVNGQTFANLSVESSLVEGIVNTGAGTDTVNVAGNISVPLTVAGGDPSANDVLNFTGDGTGAVTIDPSTSVQEAGFAAAVYTGIGTLNANAGGAAVTVDDSGSNNSLTASPTGTTASTVTVSGVPTVVNVSGATATLALSFTGTNDTLLVDGTAANDLINVNLAANPNAVQVSALQTISFNGLGAPVSLQVNGGTGSDTFNVSASPTIPIHINGDEPKGTTLPPPNGDQLNIIPNGAAVSFTPGAHVDEGAFVVGTSAAISYEDIASVTTIGPGPISLNGTNEDDTITVTAIDTANEGLFGAVGADGIQDFVVQFSDGPTLTFINAPTLVLNTGAGNDTVDINAPAPGNEDWNVAVTVNGQQPSAHGTGPTLGDTVAVETTGTAAQTVNYTPSSTIDPTTGALALGGVVGLPTITSSVTMNDVEFLTVQGHENNDLFTVSAPAVGTNTIAATPGPTTDAGTIQVNNLLGVTYQDLGPTASVTVNGNGGTATLVVNGTTGNDTIGVTGPTGAVTVNANLPIQETAVANLVLNGLGGIDTFNLTGGLPYTSTTVEAADPTINLAGATGAVTVNLGDSTSIVNPNTTITGYGGTVTLIGVTVANLDVTGGFDLTAVGTAQNDSIDYTPTGPSAGTFSNTGLNTTFNFTNATGAFTIDGGAGGAADQVTVHGDPNFSLFTINEATRTVSVENSAAISLKPVVLNANIPLFNAVGGLGNDTFLVIPARTAAGNDQVGLAGFALPTNLLVHVDGGGGGNDALVIAADATGTTLPAADFVTVLRNATAGSGDVRVFANSGTVGQPFQFPDIAYAHIGNVQANVVGGGTLAAQTLVMGPDVYDPNGSPATAVYLGSGSVINASNLAIFPNAFENPPFPSLVQAEQDWFRVVAQTTGTLDFQIYFTEYANFLPGSGDLNIQVTDAVGNPITTFGTDTAGTTNNDRRRIPVVAGETYYLHVLGALNTTVNGYSLSITNTPAPAPNSLGLNNIVALGSVNAVITPTTLTFDGSNAAVPPLPTQPLPPLSAINGFYDNIFLEFTSGALIGQRQQVTTYTAATNTFTFTSPFGAAPAVGDTFQIESNDTGRSQFDNVTRDNTPTIYIRLDAAANQGNNPNDSLIDLQGGGATPGNPPSQIITIPFWPGNSATPPNNPLDNGSYRIAVYDDTNPVTPIFLGYATTVAGQTGVFQYKVTPAQALADGQHDIEAKVEIDSPSSATNPPPAVPGAPFKDVGAPASFQVIIDTQAPPVFFGTAANGNNGLDAGSDSGIPGDPNQAATLSDRDTNVTTPTFYGVAEANAIIRLYADPNGADPGVIDNGDIYLGQTTATPLDGTNQDPNGRWVLTSNVNLNDPKFGFPFDGTRTILVTAEDAAGNVSAPQLLKIFLDTQGPQISGVGIGGNPGFNLFGLKPAESTAPPTPTPTPPVNSLVISVVDNPNRDTVDFGPGVGGNNVAIAADLAAQPGTYVLTGENTGVVAIASVTVVNNPVVNGQPATATITLNFASPLPDDRFTLSINKQNVVDLAGNQLAGFTNAFQPVGVVTFPSGNTSLTFLASFTVNSRLHIGTYASGSVALDLNGNGVFDPNNPDAVNRDATFTLGFPTDRLFAGTFADSAGVVSGFDKLGAYGFVNGQWRWLLDIDGDGSVDSDTGADADATGAGPDLNVVQTVPIDGLPIAGNWTNATTIPGELTPGAAHVGLFNGSTWYFDLLGHNSIDAADLATPGAVLTGDMTGLPIVGDFDGTGKLSLATYANGVFEFDLISQEPSGQLTGNWNEKINVQTLLPNNIGFAGVLARPVAGDMDLDGITDIGLYVPGRTDQSPGTAQWYFLVSNNPAAAAASKSAQTAAAGLAAFETLNHPFDPTPLGHDISFIFGDQQSLPLLGIWDPPTVPVTPPTPMPSGTAGWVSATYQDVLGRAPSASEVTAWVNQVNAGMSPAQVAQTFIESPERLGGIIGNLYVQYLGRTADSAGVAYWTNVWLANGGPEQVQAGIIGSPEYYVTASRMHPSLTPDQAWVTALYNNILGRAPDQAGLDYWTTYIQTNSKQSVVLGFVTSNEYRTTLINGWFETYLGRSLDTAGQQYWLSQMQQGVGQDAIQEGIIASAEFRNRYT
jgi:hypothetical protein